MMIVWCGVEGVFYDAGQCRRPVGPVPIGTLITETRDRRLGDNNEPDGEESLGRFGEQQPSPVESLMGRGRNGG
jgi:hypothetical protein